MAKLYKSRRPVSGFRDASCGFGAAKDRGGIQAIAVVIRPARISAGTLRFARPTTSMRHAGCAEGARSSYYRNRVNALPIHVSTGNGVNA